MVKLAKLIFFNIMLNHESHKNHKNHENHKC